MKQEEKRKKRYRIRRKKEMMKWNRVSILLFLFLMVIGFLIGWLMPLRPTVSEQENRNLTEFPTFQLSELLDGTYTSSISTWYADTYPFREQLLAGNRAVKSLYGIQTVGISYKGASNSDEIPDIPVKESEEETSGEAETGTEQETDSAAQTEAPYEEEISDAEESTGTEAAEATESSAAVQQEVIAPTNAAAPIAELEGQLAGNIFAKGDTGYAVYYFNKESADIYTNMVNRTADTLSGQSQIYCMLVPDSSALYISDEEMLNWGGTSQSKAQDYYYYCLNDQVNAVPILDTLMSHKEEYIYFRTDHHWTQLGAYYAYRKFAEIKGFTPHELSEYETRTMEGFLGSHYKTLESTAMEANPDVIEAYVPLSTNQMSFTQTDGVTLNWNIINDKTNTYSCFAGSDNPYSVITNPNLSDGTSIVVLKESFGNALVPFLVDHYQNVYIFDYRYFSGSIMDFIRTYGIQDVLFVNNLEAMSSKSYMEAFDGLMQ